MDERVERNVLYGGRSSNTCAFCAFHRKSLTPKQLRKHRCLAKQCTALIKHEHPIWDLKEKRRQYRIERKARLEAAYLQAIGGDAHAVHTEATSGQST